MKQTPNYKILSALRGIKYDEQMRILDHVKEKLTKYENKRQSMRIDWANIHKSLTLE
jgi:ribosomal protein L22